MLDALTTPEAFRGALQCGAAAVLLTAAGSAVVIAPYGKFGTSAFGVDLDPRLGWWLMELMATVSFVMFYPLGPNYTRGPSLLFAGLYLLHYANRGWYFPLSIRVTEGSKTRFSLLVSVTGVLVTSLHGYLNAMYYSKFCTFLDWDWVLSPTCLLGLCLYQVSFWSTIRSEYIMRNLRELDPKPGAPRYKIPRGFLFDYVSSPQYFTELTGFLGWAIMTWSPAGLFIFSISVANLVPRAIASHKWYMEKFEDYPQERKIVIPFVF
ncbi:unnamed protein product [Ectocarpus fasciculatus]